VAAAQLDVAPLAFTEVVAVLEQADFIQGVRREGNKVVSFTETIPFYDDLYDHLGRAWVDRRPTDVEQQLLIVVDGLSTAPVPLESVEDRFGLDRSDLPQVLDVGRHAGLIQVLRTIDGDLAYSPFFGFENPELLGELVTQHGSDQLATEFEALRAQQGLAISAERFPLLTDAVARGIIMAPSVELPNGSGQPFAVLPYVPDKSLLTARKPVLDKALAVVACLRTAESFGGYSNLSPAGLVDAIDKLLDPNRGFLRPHSAHKRQYQLIYRAGLIAFDPDPMPGGSWVMPRFIDNEDNREALRLARDLITHGEAVSQRIDDSVARGTLNAGDAYAAPMQTMHRTRELTQPDPAHFTRIFESAMGRRPQ
jgi:hypothetical protein